MSMYRTYGGNANLLDIDGLARFSDKLFRGLYRSWDGLRGNTSEQAVQHRFQDKIGNLPPVEESGESENTSDTSEDSPMTSEEAMAALRATFDDTIARWRASIAYGDGLGVGAGRSECDWCPVTDRGRNGS